MVDDGKGGRTKKMLAPLPSHVAKCVSDNVTLVVQTFDSYVNEGKAYLTTRDVNGASAGESVVVHTEATAALAAYRILRHVAWTNSPGSRGILVATSLSTVAGLGTFPRTGTAASSCSPFSTSAVEQLRF